MPIRASSPPPTLAATIAIGGFRLSNPGELGSLEGLSRNGYTWIRAASTWIIMIQGCGQGAHVIERQMRETKKDILCFNRIPNDKMCDIGALY